jgi:hypothetical protein
MVYDDLSEKARLQHQTEHSTKILLIQNLKKQISIYFYFN